METVRGVIPVCPLALTMPVICREPHDAICSQGTFFDVRAIQAISSHLLEIVIIIVLLLLLHVNQCRHQTLPCAEAQASQVEAVFKCHKRCRNSPMPTRKALQEAQL